jgi:hypothetical protein
VRLSHFFPGSGSAAIGRACAGGAEIGDFGERAFFQTGPHVGAKISRRGMTKRRTERSEVEYGTSSFFLSSRDYL